MKTSTIVLSAFILAGCGATLPPKELVDARAAYQTAAKGPAAQQSPAELHVAKQSLDQAERTFNDEGDSPQTKDFAYIAIRKSQLAEASARAAIAQKDREAAEREAQNLTGEQLRTAQKELASTKGNLEKTAADLAREKAAREEADRKLAQAMADLKKIADVKQEQRGMVITLSGAVLFASNESTLLPAAMVKLNEAVGIGPDRPVADNKSAEGRANNRRVEIIVEPPKK